MICEKKECTGCFACYNICPKNAIVMEEDNNGFVYPKINKDLCVNCGICKKICPSTNKVEYHDSQECFAMFAKDSRTRELSTSGGIATTLSECILNDDGVVYGASFVDGCNVEHVRVTQIEQLRKLQGSKYVHSYIKDTYKNVKRDLDNFEGTRKNVLFIGTPCQIAGLKSYLKKDYNHLIMMDIVCHGVPSQKYLKEEVLRLNGNLNIDRVNFRNKNDYGFYIINNGEITYSVKKEKSPYCDAFFRTLILRENCYNCKYACSNRISDITIGDFWGLSNTSKFYKDRQNGVSTVIISTEKGKDFINKHMDKFNMEKREYIESINGNPQLRRPAIKSDKVEKIRNDYIKYGLEKAYKRNTRFFRYKRKIKSIVKKVLKNRGNYRRV